MLQPQGVVIGLGVLAILAAAPLLAAGQETAGERELTFTRDAASQPGQERVPVQSSSLAPRR